MRAPNTRNIHYIVYLRHEKQFNFHAYSLCDYYSPSTSPNLYNYNEYKL